jgi:regulator of cell morphogenesis and NO signaling
MTIRPQTTVAEIATTTPETIRVFQQHHIDFCCGGKIPLDAACKARGLDLDLILTDLQSVLTPAAAAQPNWVNASLKVLVEHIQRTYHGPLRAELPRLSAMLDKVVSRHGEQLPGTLLPLQQTFARLQRDLLEHMAKEDSVLFPFVVALETGGPLFVADAEERVKVPIAMMEADHEEAGAALAFIRETTGGYAPPEWACPTFRGLYYGLAQLETDMHVHVHLENNVLFPRALRLARGQRTN